MARDLRPFFAPRRVAVVGAGERPTSSGGAVLQLLLRSGYGGEIIPVNPKGGTIFGLTVHSSLASVSPPADLVVIVIRPDLIPDAVEEAAATGHKRVLILPGGFAEAGAEGQARDRRVREIAEAGGVTIAGPNSAGIISMVPTQSFAPAFLRDLPPGPGRHGGIALITQSGALAEEIIAKSVQQSIPLTTVVSVGNAMHLGIENYLEFLGHDDVLGAVILYVESVADPERLRTMARAVAAKKPVLALVGGHTDRGGAAARAHTGAVPNEDAAIDAFCADCCMVRLRSARQLLLAAKGFGFYPQGLGRRALILSNSGGPGVLTADMAAASGLDLAPLPPPMAQRLRGELPGEASIANPLDLLADAREDRFGEVLEATIAAAANAYDAILGIHVVPFMVDAAPVIARLAALAPEAAAAGLPMLHSMMGTLVDKDAWFGAMEAAGVPMFNDSESMAECAALLARYPPLRARSHAGGGAGCPEGPRVLIDPVDVVRPVGRVRRQRERLPVLARQQPVADDQPAGPHQTPQQRRDGCRSFGVGRAGAGAEIGMRKCRRAAEPSCGIIQRLAEVAQHQVIGVGHQRWRAVHAQIEGVDVAVREQVAKAVIGAALAKADLQDHPVERGDFDGGEIQARALGHQPRNHLRQTIHCRLKSAVPGT